MESYTLYLDESESKNTRTNQSAFCMAGIIIKDSDYPLLEAKLNTLKQSLWPSHPAPETIILHQMEINQIKQGRRKNSGKKEYKIFTHNKAHLQLYNGLSRIFQTGLLQVTGTSCNRRLTNQYFHISNNQPDVFIMALETIMENYCHFLCANNGYGKIVYESRDLVNDQNLLDNFYHIKLRGSINFSREAFKKHLSTMIFIDKHANNAGLQIADFVPNYFARKQLGLSPHRFNCNDALRQYRYDGQTHQHSRFGVKYLP